MHARGPRNVCEDGNSPSSLLPPGLKASLERLQLEYVDVVFANRPDPNTPMEGTFSPEALTAQESRFQIEQKALHLRL